MIEDDFFTILGRQTYLHKQEKNMISKRCSKFMFKHEFFLRCFIIDTINSFDENFDITGQLDTAEIYIQSAPNNSNETYIFIVWGERAIWAVSKLLENSNMKYK